MTEYPKRKRIDFKVQNIGIDHFTLPVDILRNDGFNVTVRDDMADIQSDNAPSQHLDWKEILKCIGTHDKETIVLDIPIGHGKTTCCYNLIEHYAKQDDTVIIVLSPFRKLVNKDYEAIRTKGVNAFTYQSLANLSRLDAEPVIQNAMAMNVHVMTIHCLLQNPGEDAFIQSGVKRLYMTTLKEHCIAQNKKVVMFYDEIHESIHNFQPFFIPNLMKWMSLVSKCFVSSATFTVASYPVVKYIALLTDSNIEYIYLPRAKWDDQYRANIHLHILEEEYSKKHIFPLSHVKRLLKNNPNKQFNILCGTKSIVEAMSKKSINGKPNPYYEFTKQFNITTGDNERDFDENGNNIGTTFKTGVNVTRKDNVFVIILPVIDTSKHPRSIFNDGLPSIVQAMARLRNGGDIHVFMYMPQYIIEPDPDAYHFAPNGERIDGLWAFESYQSFRLRLDSYITDGKEDEPYTGQFSALYKLRKAYNNMQANVRSELNILSQAEQTHTLGFAYPSFEQFIMEKGYRMLVRNPIFGGDLSSLMLWCCMNGQFVNADLKHISIHTRNVETIALNQAQFRQQIVKHIPEDVLNSLKTMSFKTAFDELKHSIETGKPIGSNDTVFREFIIDGVPHSFGDLKVQPWFMKDVVLLWTEAKGLPVTKDNLREMYLIDSMCWALRGNAGQESELKNAYKLLHKVYIDFIAYCNQLIKYTKDKTPAVHLRNAIDSLPFPILKDVKVIVDMLRQYDPLVRSKGISVFQTLGKGTLQQDKDMVFTDLRDLFTNISKDWNRRKTIGKEISQFFPIEGSLDKGLPQSANLYLF